MVVRLDGLIDENEVIEYEIYLFLIRSVIFNVGKVSRINVGYFMLELINDDKFWNNWKG